MLAAQSDSLCFECVDDGRLSMPQWTARTYVHTGSINCTEGVTEGGGGERGKRRKRKRRSDRQTKKTWEEMEILGFGLSMIKVTAFI